MNKTEFRLREISFRLSIIIICLAKLSTIASEPSGVSHHVMKLTLNEFSILNVSEMDGLLKYGGSGEFKLNMAREGTNEVVWTVTVENPRLMELLGIFVGEKTVKLVQSLDANNLDTNQKLALQAIKSLTQKLELAQKTPVWDSVKLSGQVSPHGTNSVLEAKEGDFVLTGEKVGEVRNRKGVSIVAEGFVKKPGEYELVRFMDKKANTLEVFVMSQCPFGKRAELALLNFLARTNANPKPRLEIHYLFYKQTKDGKDVFTSLHGEPEVVENLVQIVIRDRFHNFFEPYVRARAEGSNLAWSKLAEHAGMTKESVAQVEKAIVTEREGLIAKEYDYAAGQHDIRDGSPSYVWESEKVMNLRGIEAIKGLEAAAQGTCAQ